MMEHGLAWRHIVKKRAGVFLAIKHTRERIFVQCRSRMMHSVVRCRDGQKRAEVALGLDRRIVVRFLVGARDFYTEWPKKMYTLFTHQYLWNKFK